MNLRCVNYCTIKVGVVVLWCSRKFTTEECEVGKGTLLFALFFFLKDTIALLCYFVHIVIDRKYAYKLLLMMTCFTLITLVILQIAYSFDLENFQTATLLLNHVLTTKFFF